MPVLYSIDGVKRSYDQVQPASAAPSADLDFDRELLSKAWTSGPPTNSSAHPAKSEPASAHYGNGIGREADPRRQALFARDLMTSHPKCVSEQDPLETAAQLMRSYKFRHVPVTTPERRLSGMLSDRDLLKAGAGAMGQPIFNHMTAQVLTATPDTLIQEVAKAMLDHRFHSIPIIDSDHRVVGILTTTDILRAIVRHAPVNLWI